MAPSMMQRDFKTTTNPQNNSGVRLKESSGSIDIDREQNCQVFLKIFKNVYW